MLSKRELIKKRLSLDFTIADRRYSAFELLFLWEPRDVWIGIFWDRDKLSWGRYDWTIYFCVLTLVLRVSWTSYNEGE